MAQKGPANGQAEAGEVMTAAAALALFLAASGYPHGRAGYVVVPIQATNECSAPTSLNNPNAYQWLNLSSAALLERMRVYSCDGITRQGNSLIWRGQKLGGRTNG
jgi:hypothetical protein